MRAVPLHFSHLAELVRLEKRLHRYYDEDMELHRVGPDCWVKEDFIKNAPAHNPNYHAFVGISNGSVRSFILYKVEKKHFTIVKICSRDKRYLTTLLMEVNNRARQTKVRTILMTVSDSDQKLLQQLVALGFKAQLMPNNEQAHADKWHLSFKTHSGNATTAQDGPQNNS